MATQVCLTPVPEVTDSQYRSGLDRVRLGVGHLQNLCPYPMPCGTGLFTPQPGLAQCPPCCEWAEKRAGWASNHVARLPARLLEGPAETREVGIRVTCQP